MLNHFHFRPNTNPANDCNVFSYHHTKETDKGRVPGEQLVVVINTPVVAFVSNLPPHMTHRCGRHGYRASSDRNTPQRDAAPIGSVRWFKQVTGQNKNPSRNIFKYLLDSYQRVYDTRRTSDGLINVDD